MTLTLRCELGPERPQHLRLTKVTGRERVQNVGYGL